MRLHPILAAAKFRLARVYWKLVRPRTFGVKALVFAAGDFQKTLLVRHTYGDTSLWNLAGGGFNPKREREADAVRREIEEELGVAPVSVRRLGTYQTGTEGKIDTVGIFEVIIHRMPDDARQDGELKTYGWFDLDYPTGRKDVARIVRTAVRQHRGENDFESYV